MSDLIILGTDTDAGKTTFALLWLAAFGEYGYWKPVETVIDWSVESVAELERRDRQGHRDPPALLLGIEVAHRGSVLDLPEAGDRAGDEQERLGQGRLAGPAVTDEGDVADLGRRERLHKNPRCCVVAVE